LFIYEIELARKPRFTEHMRGRCETCQILKIIPDLRVWY